MLNKFYVTTSIPYVNAKPHLGHTLDALYADVLARHYRGKEFDVILQVGLDENGQKNYLKAKEQGLSVEDFLQTLRPTFVKFFQTLDISYDIFTKTSDQQNHWPASQEVWKRALAKGDIYKKQYKGYYCVGCECFKKLDELVDGLCPDHQTKPEEIEEENYFFALSKYEEFLKEHFRKNPDFVYPKTSYNEAWGLLERGLEDVSISRPKSRLPWGVPVPNDEDHVMYVWFDALINYLSGIGFPKDMERFNRYWPTDMEIVGKDNNRWHTLLWPAMLKSADLDLPKKVLVHYYILGTGGVKMSKTIGNVIDPIDVMEKYGTDAFRYYLLSRIPMDKDGIFDVALFEGVYDSDLSNGLGNLLQRTISMINKYEVKVGFPAELSIDDKDRNNSIRDLICASVESLNFAEGLKIIWQIVDDCNAQIENDKPWELAKNGEESRLSESLNFIYQNLWGISELLVPFMPQTSEKMQKQLKSLEPEPLFPRLEK